MRTLLDGTILNIARPTLADAMRAATEIAQSRNLMIVSVKADGRVLPHEALEEPSEEADRYGEVVIATLPAAKVIAGSLRDAADSFERIMEGQVGASRAIQEGRTEEGLKQLHPILASWQAVRTIVENSGEILKIDLTRVGVPGIDAQAPVGACTASLASALKELKAALADQDWSRLGDIVGYDLDALARDWKMVLSALADYVESLPRPERTGGT